MNSWEPGNSAPIRSLPDFSIYNLHRENKQLSQAGLKELQEKAKIIQFVCPVLSGPLVLVPA